jgi:hypothetical protein
MTNCIQEITLDFNQVFSDFSAEQAFLSVIQSLKRIKLLPLNQLDKSLKLMTLNSKMSNFTEIISLLSMILMNQIWEAKQLRSL